MVIKCLEAGKHVLSEKPIGKDIKTAKALVEEYEKRFAPKGLIWRVAESKFFWMDWTRTNGRLGI
jgi:predicted dehydrogenase